MRTYQEILADCEARMHIARMEGVLIGAMVAFALIVAALRLPKNWLPF